MNEYYIIKINIKMFLSLYEAVCSLDKYGYKFSFNFHGKRPQYNTFLGGMATIGMYGCLLILFGYQISIMHGYRLV